MSKEKTIWVQPIFFKAEAKVDIDHVIGKLIEAMKQDRDIYYMQCVSDLRKQLHDNPLHEIFKCKTLEEEGMLEEFLNFMKAKRRGVPAELNLKTL